MPRKVKLILNPMADMGRAWKTANALRPIAQEFQGELTWSGTVYPTHAIELARQAIHLAVIEYVVVHRASERPCIVKLLRIDPGRGTAGDVADIVRAGAARSGRYAVR